MASFVTRSKSPYDGWYGMEEVNSYYPGSANCGLFIPVDADDGSTTMPNSIHGSGVSLIASVSSTVSGGVHTVAGSTTINLNPDPAINSATRNIVYAWGFCRDAGNISLYSGTSDLIIGYSNGFSPTTDKGALGLEITSDNFDTMTNSAADFTINLGTARESGVMYGSIIRLDFDYPNDLLTLTVRSGGIEGTITDTYKISSPGVTVIDQLKFAAGAQTLGAGVLRFEDDDPLTDWRTIWDVMEAQWLAGNRVMPKGFLV